MKIYAIRHKASGQYVRIGNARRYTWNQFPTNVIQYNIPEERRAEYEVEEFNLQQLDPVRKFTTDKTLISHQSWNLKK